MAHIAKYKATSVGHMLAHYRRDESSLGRDNIDPKRVKNDMVVAHYTNKDGKLVVGRVVPREGEPNWGTVERRIERVNEAQKAAGKRATRKDAVVMADVVVTLPDNVRKGDEDRFFRLTYWYLSNKFGIDNMMGGYVHKDEVLKDGTPARDHMHAPFTPILDGRFNYKKMCPRAFYQSLHKELGDYLEKQMGYRPEVELEDETRAMRVYTDKSADIAKVRGAVERGIVEPAERQAAQAVEDAAQRVEEARAELDELRGAVSAEQARLESLRQGTRAIERDVAELRPIAAEIGRWEAADRAGKRAILDSIAARCAGAARAARAAIEELGDRIRALMRPRKAQRTVGDVRREATEAARASEALGRNHVAPTNSRSRGQAR